MPAVPFKANAKCRHHIQLSARLGAANDVKHRSLTTLRRRFVKIGAEVVRHGRSVIFQMAEVAVPRDLFRQILLAISTLRPSPPARC
jgi:hypothetical protein